MLEDIPMRPANLDEIRYWCEGIIGHKTRVEGLPGEIIRLVKNYQSSDSDLPGEIRGLMGEIDSLLGSLTGTVKETKGVTLYKSNAAIFFPTKAEPETLRDGLVELIGEIIPGGYHSSNPEKPHFTKDKRYKTRITSLDPEVEVPFLDIEVYYADEDLGYHLDCEVSVRTPGNSGHKLIFTKVCEFVQKYGNMVVLDVPEKEIEPILPYEGREIDIVVEVEKIDIEALRVLDSEIARSNSRFGDAENLGMGLYLSETGRLRPDNALMVMGYEGRGLFTIFGHWEDVDIDDRTNLVKRNSKGKNTEYVQVDYSGCDEVDISKEDQTVDSDVTRAVIAYAQISGYIQKHGKFNPFEITEDANLVTRSLFPQQLLDLSQDDKVVKAQLVEYLSI